MAVEGLMAHGPPAQPKWLFFLTVGIIVLSFGAFIAACVNVSAYDSWGWSASSGPGGFMIFDAIFTWIVLGTMIAFQYKFQKFYIRLTYVVLLPLCAIFWLSAWAWAASVASAFRGYDSFFRDSALDRFSRSIAACAALGAFTWVAIVVLTIFYIVACLRDDTNTAHSTEMGMGAKTEPTPTTGPVPTAGTDGAAFNQQTQDYYGTPQTQAQPEVPVQQQTAAYPQEMSSPNQYQQPQHGSSYPADNTSPYPNEQAPRA
jgi:hypothetical protein